MHAAVAAPSSRSRGGGGSGGGLVGQLDVAQDGDHVAAEALVVVVEFGTAPTEVGGVLKEVQVWSGERGFVLP